MRSLATPMYAPLHEGNTGESDQKLLDPFSPTLYIHSLRGKILGLNRMNRHACCGDKITQFVLTR